MVDWYEDAIQQAIDASLPGFENKADAVRYYMQEYPSKGKGGWKQHIIHDLLPFTQVSNEHNLARRFDSGAKGGKRGLSNPEVKNSKQYQNLALWLKLRKAPPGGYHVHYSGGVQFSEKCEPEEFDVDITGELADDVAAHPENILKNAFKVWLGQEDEEEASAGPCDEDGEPLIIVTANPDDFVSKGKRKKKAMPFFKQK